MKKMKKSHKGMNNVVRRNTAKKVVKQYAGKFGK